MGKNVWEVCVCVGGAEEDMYQNFYAESVRTVWECDAVETRSSCGGGCGGKDAWDVVPLGGRFTDNSLRPSLA